jgi:hypothetical protein
MQKLPIWSSYQSWAWHQNTNKLERFSAKWFKQRFSIKIVSKCNSMPSVSFVQSCNVKIERFIDLSQLPCTHEEVGTRLLFYVNHLFDKGFKKFMTQATDSDVVVISLAICSILPDCEIWVAFGHGKRLWYVPCHTLNSILAPRYHVVFFSFMPSRDVIMSLHF